MFAAGSLLSPVLEGENGYSLRVGIGPTAGFVQHSHTDGSLPLVALAPDSYGTNDDDNVEFLMGGTPTPIPRRNCLSTSACVILSKAGNEPSDESVTNEKGRARALP